jgi:hypothetical protein
LVGLGLLAAGAFWLGWAFFINAPSGEYVLDDMEFHGVNVTVARDGEFCEATSANVVIPDSAVEITPNVFGNPLKGEPTVYWALYYTDVPHGARAVDTATCMIP